MRTIIYPIVLVTLFLAACSEKSTEQELYDPAQDYFTFANTDQFITEKIALDLTVDFDNEQISGSATLTMRRLDADATEVVLDTRDLSVAGV